MKYKLIILDCDETLARTAEIINGIFVDTLHKHAPHQYKKFDEKFVTQTCVGITLHDIFERMAKDTNVTLSQDLLDLITQEYQDVYARELPNLLQKDPEQIRILTDISKDSALCVASNGRTRNVVATVAATGLSDIIPAHHIFTAEDKAVTNPKPAPDLIIYTMQKMGVTDPRKVLMIDDSVNGGKSGIAAGIDVVGFTHHIEDKATRRAELLQAGTLAVVDNWKEFQEFVLT